MKNVTTALALFLTAITACAQPVIAHAPAIYYTETGNLVNPSHPADSTVEEANFNLFIPAKQPVFIPAGNAKKFRAMKDIEHTAPILEGMLFTPLRIMARVSPAEDASLYTGVVIEQTFENGDWEEIETEINTSMHYVFANGNFAGIETSLEFMEGEPSVIIRTQVNIAVFKDISVGIMAGVPAYGETDGLSAITRLIWTP